MLRELQHNFRMGRYCGHLDESLDAPSATVRGSIGPGSSRVCPAEPNYIVAYLPVNADVAKISSRFMQNRRGSNQAAVPDAGSGGRQATIVNLLKVDLLPLSLGRKDCAKMIA